MAISYIASTTISADREAVEDFFKQPNLAKDYFPEVQKRVNSVGAYRLAAPVITAANRPDCYSANGFGWIVGSGTRIDLPRRDINANILTIDVEYKQSGRKTIVSILVKFDPTPGFKGLSGARSLAASHVRMMVSRKLTAIKRDVEANLEYAWGIAVA